MKPTTKKCLPAKSGKKNKFGSPRINTGDLKKYLIRLLPYLLIAWFGNRIAWLYRTSPGGDQALYKFINAMSHFNSAFQSPLPSLHPYDLLFGAGFSLCFFFVILYRRKNAKKYRPGMEYGSARWSA